MGNDDEVEQEEINGCMWNVNYDDLAIHIGKNVKDFVELKFCQIQYSVKVNLKGYL